MENNKIKDEDDDDYDDDDDDEILKQANKLYCWEISTFIKQDCHTIQKMR